MVSIWLCNTQSYSYTTDSPIRTIWGFVKYKRTKRSNTHTYYAPINCNKVGKEVCISDTRPYTAMQLNLNPLEAAFFLMKYIPQVDDYVSMEDRTCKR